MKNIKLKVKETLMSSVLSFNNNEKNNFIAYAQSEMYNYKVQVSNGVIYYHTLNNKLQ